MTPRDSAASNGRAPSLPLPCPAASTLSCTLTASTERSATRQPRAHTSSAHGLPRTRGAKPAAARPWLRQAIVCRARERKLEKERAAALHQTLKTVAFLYICLTTHAALEFYYAIAQTSL